MKKFNLNKLPKILSVIILLLMISSNIFAASMAFQERFRWRNDNGSETTATWKAELNVPISNVAKIENIRLRFVLDETELGPYSADYWFQMRWSTSPGGTYTTFSDAAGAPFTLFLTDNFTNLDPTTEQLGSGNGLSWEAVGVCSEVNGDIAKVLTDCSFFEMEYCLQATDDAIAGQTYYFSSQLGVWAGSIFASFTMATSSGAPVASDNPTPSGTGAQTVTAANTEAVIDFSNVTLAGPMNFDRWDVVPPNNPPANGMAKYWSVSQGTTQFSGNYCITLPISGMGGYTPDQLVIMVRDNENSSWMAAPVTFVTNNTFLKAIGLSSFSQFTIAPGTQNSLSGGAGTSSDPFQISNLNDLETLSGNTAYWASGFYFIQTADIDATATSGCNGGAGFIPIGTAVDNAFSGFYDGQNNTIDGLYINRPANEWQAMFGFTLDATIKNLGLTNVSITSNNYCGALISEMLTSSISNCYSTGTVKSTLNQAGGLIAISGFSGGASNLSGCYSSCTVECVNSGGGLIAYLGNGSTISNSYSTGDVTSTGSNVGGFIGMIQYNTIVTNCYSTGNVVGTVNVGGLLGHAWDSETITSCYSLGDVSGTDDMGGLIGHMGGGSINNCYSRGDVTDTDGTGGMGSAAFCGYVMNGAFNNCYTTGSVFYDVGDDPTDRGFVGGNWEGTFSNNFFDSEVSNQTTALGATAKTTAEMKTQSTFTDVGWDFLGETTNGENDYWGMKSGINDDYAYLTMQRTDWTGTISSVWDLAGNWWVEAIPPAVFDITIPNVAKAYSPVISPTCTATCNNLTINSGASLTIKSDNTGTGSLITNGTITNNGTVNVERYISESVWHLISVSNNNTTANFFLGDYLQTWDETTAAWSDITEPTTALTPAKGYGLWGTPAKATTYTFTGTPNTGDQNLAITYNENGSGNKGTNLLGNPFPSSLDWDGLRITYGSVYYWNGTAYVSWNNGGDGSRYVPPMQGFFIVTDADMITATGGMFGLGNTNRVHNDAGYYKSGDQMKSNSIVLETYSNNYSDKLYVRFNAEASEGFDLQHDAWKFLSNTEGLSQLYSFTGDKILSIDVRPETEVIQLGFQNDKNGIYSIAIKEIADISEAILEDTKTNIFHDLNKGSYEFAWDINDNEKRFKLHLDAVGIEEGINVQSNILIYASNQQIHIKGVEKGKVIISDIMGRIVMEKNISGSELSTIPVNLKTGVYLVMVVSGERVYTEKVFVK